MRLFKHTFYISDKNRARYWWALAVLLLLLVGAFLVYANLDEKPVNLRYPLPESAYSDPVNGSMSQRLLYRIQVEPFNAIASLIFFLAITHTMCVSFIQKASQRVEAKYDLLIKADLRDKESKSIVAGLLHLLGEVEVVFGIWGIILAFAISFYFDWHVFVTYTNSLHYTEPLFIIVIMSIASSRPVLKFFETVLWRISRLLGGSIEAWWLTILIFTPLLGSLITEPAAMTIAAFLLADKFYVLNPSTTMKYVTLGLLFVNVSIGGALTHFAAPPVLMVSVPWGWDTVYMFTHFGWKSVLAILISTGLYFVVYKKQLHQLDADFEKLRYKQYIQHRFIPKKELESDFEQLEKIVDKNVAYTSELNAFTEILKENIKTLANERLSKEELDAYAVESAIEERFEEIKREEFQRTIPGLLTDFDHTHTYDPAWDTRENPVPLWVMAVHLFLLFWTVLTSQEPVMFMAGFLFYLGFFEITSFYQNRLDLKPALMVAFFIAGIMLHGNLQAWWISPLLANLPELNLNFAAIFLTSFNDNAAITYLSTFVVDFPENMKYAVVTGAITGGGLTLIANAPNPVGQSILKRFFYPGISSGLLLRFAALPTVITALVFYIFK